MIKHFCDQCGQELGKHNTCAPTPVLTTLETCGRVSGRHLAMQFYVTVGLKESKGWNTGDFCKYCVIDAVNSLDDRDRPNPA